jgi:hypothetical protein
MGAVADMAVTIRSLPADELAQRRGYRAGVCQRREPMVIVCYTVREKRETLNRNCP